MEKNTKKFLGIYFNDIEWQVVPSKWVTSADKLMCYWPNSGHVETLARNSISPRKNWTEWPIRSVPVSSGELGRLFITDNVKLI